MMLSEQEIQRRDSLKNIEEHGINPYPANAYDITHNALQIIKNFDNNPTDYTSVSLAGRILRRRIMGTASFAEIQDASGKIQIYVNRDEIASKENPFIYNTFFKKWLDIGDIVGVKGYIFKTKTGEISIHVKSLTLLSKSLKPIPLPKDVIDDKTDDIKSYDAFDDPEQRYRQRYVDLIVNPKVKHVFIQRTKMVSSIRSLMESKGYLEVETPILQPIYGGAAAKPFKTHHNKLNMTLYMRIANELYLKRLIVGGFDGVFEFAKDFRNEGMSRFHNPEFTQMELYVAYKDYNWMMDIMEEMVEKVALDLHKTSKIPVGDNIIDFKRPWQRYTMFEAIQKYTEIDISEMDETELRKVCEKLNISVDKSMGKGKLIDEIFGEYCEPKLIQPTFITDYPEEMSPLTKKHRTKKGLVERFEAICNGKEIMNAYSELNDPIDQRKRFEKQLELAKRGDEEAMMLDEDFLNALEYGMPPTAGVGVGIDRLAMIMTNSNSIQDVLFFPQMKPNQQSNLNLSHNASDILKQLKEQDEIPLLALKEQAGLSNKQWDKAIKELTRNNIAVVEKIEDVLIIKSKK